MSIDRQFGWMWAQACELLDRADRMQRQFVRYVGPSADAAVWEPPVDIQETPGGLQFVFALPGVSPEHIEVSLDLHWTHCRESTRSGVNLLPTSETRFFRRDSNPRNHCSTTTKLNKSL